MVQNLNNSDEFLPKVSVCLPVYNGEKYIAQCIGSILAQDYQNMEVIISDNCSTDRTIDIINKYLYDKRIKFYQNKTNIGMQANGLKTLNYVSGDWIVLIGSDDYFIDRTFISQGIKRLSASDKISILCGSYKSIRANNVIEDFSDETDAVFNGKEYFLKGFDGIWKHFNFNSIIIKFSEFKKIKKINKFIISAGDIYYFLNFFLNGDVYVLSKPFLMYRYHENNTSDCKNIDDLINKFIYDSLVPITIYESLKKNNIFLRKILDKWLIKNLFIFILRNIPWYNFKDVINAYEKVLITAGFSIEELGIKSLFKKIKDLDIWEDKIYYGSTLDIKLSDLINLDEKNDFSIYNHFKNNYPDKIFDYNYIFDNDEEIKNNIIINIRKQIKLIGKLAFHYNIKKSLENIGIDIKNINSFFNIFIYSRLYSVLPLEFQSYSFSEDTCAGIFEQVNGLSGNIFEIYDKNTIIIGKGWIINLSKKQAPESVFLMLIKDNQIKYFIETNIYERPDVSEKTQFNAYKNCGYEFVIPSYLILSGEYNIITIFIKDCIAAIFDNNKKVIFY